MSGSRGSSPACEKRGPTVSGVAALEQVGGDRQDQHGPDPQDAEPFYVDMYQPSMDVEQASSSLSLARIRSASGWLRSAKIASASSHAVRASSGFPAAWRASPRWPRVSAAPRAADSLAMQVQGTLVAGSGVGVVAELLMGVPEAVQRVGHPFGVAEVTEQVKSLPAVTERLLVIPEYGVEPADRVQGHSPAGQVAGGRPQLKRPLGLAKGLAVAAPVIQRQGQCMLDVGLASHLQRIGGARAVMAFSRLDTLYGLAAAYSSRVAGIFGGPALERDEQLVRMQEWPLRSYPELPALPASVRPPGCTARTSSMVADGSPCDTVRLLVWEIITNAIRASTRLAHQECGTGQAARAVGAILLTSDGQSVRSRYGTRSSPFHTSETRAGRRGRAGTADRRDLEHTVGLLCAGRAAREVVGPCALVLNTSECLANVDDCHGGCQQPRPSRRDRPRATWLRIIRAAQRVLPPRLRRARTSRSPPKPGSPCRPCTSPSTPRRSSCRPAMSWLCRPRMTRGPRRPAWSPRCSTPRWPAANRQFAEGTPRSWPGCPAH